MHDAGDRATATDGRTDGPGLGTSTAPAAGDLVSATVTGETVDEAVEAAIATLHDYERAGFELVDYVWRPQGGRPAATADLTFRTVRTWATPPGARVIERPARSTEAKEAKYLSIGLTVLVVVLLIALFAFRLWQEAEDRRLVCEYMGPDVEWCDQ